MGYALFASRKQVLDSELNCYQLQQTQRSNEQFELATEKIDDEERLSKLKGEKSQQLANLYGQLVEVPSTDTAQRDQINYEIKVLEAEFQAETEKVNQEIYEVSKNENIIEMEVKRLDTVVTNLKEQLQAVQQAEGQGIKEAVPKFNGIN